MIDTYIQFAVCLVVIAAFWGLCFQINKVLTKIETYFWLRRRAKERLNRV
jgi:hypothetical protein